MHKITMQDAQSWIALFLMSTSTSTSKKGALALPNSSSKQLSLYIKSYKGGAHKDLHLDIFQATQELVQPTKVLYPGCHRHLTASLVFDNVLYVDCDKKVGALYTDAAARQFVVDHKLYARETTYSFQCRDVTQHPKLDNDFDLLISLSAGILSQPCKDYVRPNGWLLVNDSHSDARHAFVHEKDWKLERYWDGSQFTAEKLDECFQVIARANSGDAPRAMTQANVDESIAVGSVSKRSFRLVRSPMFFLFRKL